MRARRSVTIAAVALAVGALALAGTVPAGAHTDKLFTVDMPNSATSIFSTVDKSTAVVTPLGPAIPGDTTMFSVEIHDEVGYAVGYIDEGTGIVSWNHSNGQLTGSVQLNYPGEFEAGSVQGLDTVVNGGLPNGTLLTYAQLDGTLWLASVNPATGLLTPVVDLTVPWDDYSEESIATDPTTGITYLFFDDDAGPVYFTADLVLGTVDGPFSLDVLADELEVDRVLGADFDAAGTLWFLAGGWLNSTVGAFNETVNAVGHGETTGSIPGLQLTVDPAPVLPATGLDAAASTPLAATALALLLAGGAVVVLRRRRSVP
jgi:LPXTG-motif cell wall-anchored protein